MPVGGGHHGGGGGHTGGGHHGGGFHGGHHHGGYHHHHHGYHHGYNHGYNHHYHRRHFGVFYYSPFRWFYRGLVLLASVVIIGFVLMSIGVSKTFSGPTLHQIIASPQDDRILSYSQSSCGSIELSTFQYSYPVEIYLLNSKPQVVDGANFEVSNSWYLGSNDYRYYNYYLLSGSSISLSLYVSSSTVNVYILTKKEFDRFDHDDSFNSKLYAQCQSTASSSPCEYSYTVQTDDEYYMVFEATNSYFSVYPTLNIQKKIFLIDYGDIYSNCSAFCSLSVPSSPTLYPVVITGDVTDGTWTDSVQYTWSCTSVFSIPAWVYIVLIVGILVSVISVVGVVVTVVYLCYKKRTTPDSAPLITDAPAVPPTAPNLSQPPPVVPSYPTQPPSYNWVKNN